jgi:hypothetical protein
MKVAYQFKPRTELTSFNSCVAPVYLSTKQQQFEYANLRIKLLKSSSVEIVLNLFSKEMMQWDFTASSTANTLFSLFIHFQGEGNELAASRAGWLDGLFGCFRPVFWSFAAKANKGIFPLWWSPTSQFHSFCFRTGQVTIGKFRSIPSAIWNGSDPEPRALCSRAASATMWWPSRKSKTRKRQTFDI